MVSKVEISKRLGSYVKVFVILPEGKKKSLKRI
jgi:hypothetical protein